MPIEELLPLAKMLSEVGFMAGITIYLLVSKDKIIAKNTEAINALTQAVGVLMERTKK